MTVETDHDMSNRRKRLRFRCHHTGMKENDLLFGAFVDRHLDQLTDDDVVFFEALLRDNNDLDLYNWVTRKEPVPDGWAHPVMEMLQSFKYAR
jgi:antitoxin CptB